MGSEVKTPMGLYEIFPSLTSLGEDLVDGELLFVHWQGVDPSSTSPYSIAYSITSAGASSPSAVGWASRPFWAQIEREIAYAQLDLALDEIE